MHDYIYLAYATLLFGVPQWLTYKKIKCFDKSQALHILEREKHTRRNLKATQRSMTRLIDVPSSEHPLFFQEKYSFEALVAYQKEDQFELKTDHLTSQLSYSKPTCHKG